MSSTKGPWKVRETKDGMTIRENRKRLEVVAPCGGGEMVIVGKHTGLDCLRSANASLIASAPDLLRALQMISNFTKCQCAATHGDNPICAVLIAEAAIAKAEGRDAP